MKVTLNYIFNMHFNLIYIFNNTAKTSEISLAARIPEGLFPRNEDLESLPVKLLGPAVMLAEGQSNL